MAQPLSCRGVLHTIEDCEWQFRFQCPQAWDQRSATEDAEVRHCDVCLRSEYRCQSPEVAREHTPRGHCVAVAAAPRDDGEDVILLGDLTPQLPRLVAILAREQGVYLPNVGNLRNR